MGKVSVPLLLLALWSSRLSNEGEFAMLMRAEPVAEGGLALSDRVVIEGERRLSGSETVGEGRADGKAGGNFLAPNSGCRA